LIEFCTVSNSTRLARLVLKKKHGS